MRRIAIFFFFILIATTIKSQVANWTLHPKYDDVEILSPSLFKVSVNGKYGIAGPKDKEITTITYDSIGDIHSGRVVCFGKDKNVVCYVDSLGKECQTNASNYYLDDRCPYFHDGCLTVRCKYNNVVNSEYWLLVGNDSKNPKGPYYDIFPANEGYVVAVSGSSPDKRVYNLISVKDYTPVVFDVNIDNSDVAFVSTVNNGKSLVVIKKRFYTYDVENKQLIPLSIDGTLEKKSLVTAVNKDITLNRLQSGYQIMAKNATFFFDDFMRLKAWQLGNKDIINFDIREDSVAKEGSSLSAYQKAGSALYGLCFKNDILLPQQFDKVLTCVGNLALVKQNGKAGVIGIDEKAKINFKLNEGHDVAFEHSYVNTTLVSTFPTYINPSAAKVDSHTKECSLKAETRKDNQNIETSSITYNCQLTMSDSISEENAPVDYKFSLSYNGLYSKDYQVSLDERYIKGYEVSLSDISYGNQVATVLFDVIPTNASSGHFEKKVEVKPQKEEQVVVLEKTGDTSYKAKIFGIETPNIMFDVVVTEDGCPSVTYPFLENLSVKEDKQKTVAKKKVMHKSTGEIVRKKPRKAAPKQKTGDAAPLFIPN